MKKLHKIGLIAIVFIFIGSIQGCANARWGTNAGVDVVWGSHGPKIRPHINLDLYNGGKVRH